MKMSEELNFLILNRRLEKYTKLMTKENMHLIRLKVEDELIKIKSEFNKLKEKKIISTVIYPKSKNYRYKKKIYNLLKSRNNLKYNQRLIREFIKENIKRYSNV